MVLIEGGIEEVVVFIVVMLLDVSVVVDGLKVVFLVDAVVVVNRIIVVVVEVEEDKLDLEFVFVEEVGREIIITSFM
jgi:hypothetical protein